MKNRTKQNARLGFGWVPDLPDNRDHLYAAPMAKLGPLPRKVNLRRHCPPVYNQGQIGSCTANAIAAAIEFDRKKQKLADFVPSRLFIYYNERSMEHSVSIDNGAEIRDGIKSVGKQGACPEREWSYDDTPADSTTNVWPAGAKPAQRPPKSCYMDAKKFRALNYQRVGRTLTQMKGCLADGYPFVFGFTVYDSFESAEVEKTGVLNMPASREGSSAATPFSRWATTTKRNALLCAIRGARAGAKEVTSRCLILICSRKIFRTISGPSAWCIKCQWLPNNKCSGKSSTFLTKNL